MYSKFPFGISDLVEQVRASRFQAPPCRLRNASSTLMLRITKKIDDLPKQSMDMEFSLGGTKQTIDQRPLVLAVDDDEDNLHLLAYILEVLDCAVITAGNGEDTLTLAKKYQPDIILLDIILPDLHGIEVIHRLKQNAITSLIPIIAVTALARTQIEIRLCWRVVMNTLPNHLIFKNLENLIRYYFVKSEKFFKNRAVTSCEVLVNQPIQQ